MFNLLEVVFFLLFYIVALFKTKKFLDLLNIIKVEFKIFL